MAKIKVHNPNPDPLIITSSGRFLGGNETANAVDDRDDLVRQHLQAGRLVIPSTNPTIEEASA